MMKDINNVVYIYDIPESINSFKFELIDQCIYNKLLKKWLSQ